MKPLNRSSAQSVPEHHGELKRAIKTADQICADTMVNLGKGFRHALRRWAVMLNEDVGGRLAQDMVGVEDLLPVDRTHSGSTAWDPINQSEIVVGSGKRRRPSGAAGVSPALASSSSEPTTQAKDAGSSLSPAEEKDQEQAERLLITVPHAPYRRTERDPLRFGRYYWATVSRRLHRAVMPFPVELGAVSYKRCLALLSKLSKAIYTALALARRYLTRVGAARDRRIGREEVRSSRCVLD